MLRLTGGQVSNLVTKIKFYSDLNKSSFFRGRKMKIVEFLNTEPEKIKFYLEYQVSWSELRGRKSSLIVRRIKFMFSVKMGRKSSFISREYQVHCPISRWEENQVLLSENKFSSLLSKWKENQV